MTDKIKGLIQWVSDKHPDKDEYGIKMNDTWYNGKGPLPVHAVKGEKIEIEYLKATGDRKIIVSTRLLEVTEQVPEKTGSNSTKTARGRDRLIRMQTFVKAGSELVSRIVPPGTEIEAARKLIWETAEYWEAQGTKEGYW